MKVLLTGARGMLGSSIALAWRRQRPDDELVEFTRERVDLRDRAATGRAIHAAGADAVVHTAAAVGGIAAKIEHPTRYLLDNLLIDTSVISAAIDSKIPELLYIGSAAVYPDHFRQPLVETDLLAAPLEPANEGYALAKIAATKLCEYASDEFGYAYRVGVPSNLYGPADDFSASHGHLVAAALGKVHAAYSEKLAAVSVWGDGTARREFTFSEDVASWLVDQVGRLGEWPPMLNLGVGVDHTIAEYYTVASQVVGYSGALEFDVSKPTGTHQRLLDSTAARALGWKPTTSLADGMAVVYRAYLREHPQHGETK